MQFKPFATLARVSFAKGITYAYAPSVVATGQSSFTTTNSIGHVHNYPPPKFAKASQFQNVFAGAPTSSGTGVKTGHAPSHPGVDSGLAQYYAAWQHAQQTGDDTDWRQHQFSRRIGWKHHESSANTKPGRLDATRPVDILRPSPRATGDRAYSETAAEDIKKAEDSLTEAEALAKVDEAIAQEIKDLKASRSAGSAAARDEVSEDAQAYITSEASVESPVANSETSASLPDQSTTTSITEPDLDEATSLSRRIVELGEQRNYGEIPAVFEAMLREGYIPSVNAYNQIIVSAIKLSEGTFQVSPRALEIYSDMSRRGVQPNHTTYSILVNFLTKRALEAHRAQNSIEKRQARYGDVSQSTELDREVYMGDKSLVLATKLYNVARAKIQDFTMQRQGYTDLVNALAQEYRVDDMITVLDDMNSRQIETDAQLYKPMITAFGAVKDINAASDCYTAYRDIAIRRGFNDPEDMEVYAALVRAFFSCGFSDAGNRFYEKVLQSFEESEERMQLTSAMRTSYLVRAVIDHHVESGSLSEGLHTVMSQTAEAGIKDQALAKICVVAADLDDSAVAEAAFAALHTSISVAGPLEALTAMHIRRGDLASARMAWGNIMSLPNMAATTDLTVMYAVALIRSGSTEEGFEQARTMFAKIRGLNSASDGRLRIMNDIDEAIIFFGEVITQGSVVASPQASMTLIRIMIENGGLVSPVAEHAIARLGPECVVQLGAQDIALALHVQANVILSPSRIIDPANANRFTHLLDTVLSRGLALDLSTVPIVTDALAKIHGARSELALRWQKFIAPPAAAMTTPALYSPQIPASPIAHNGASNEAYDPYAHTTDFRASRAIGDLLESSNVRFENQLSDALSRFRNVRRAGRHVQYSTYAKLITAAGKANQPNLINEVLGMAQSDIPLLQQYPAVKAGWVTILDSVVAACLTVGNRELAGKYHQDLLNMGLAPSANTFGIYITTLEGTFDEATEAVRIFQRALSEGVEPSVFLYNAVIGKLGKARRIDDCLFYFSEMQNRNIRPSSVTYGTLVNALCRTSEERLAEDMFEEMESMPNYKAKAAPYNSIIQYFLNTKRDRGKVLTYYKRMKARGIKPTSHTYKLLIEANASLEPVDLSAAEAILKEMQEAGVKPEAVHYGTLIHAKGCVLHDMAGARATFDEVLANCSLRVTDNLYQNLLESMVANHQVAETAEILENMRSHHIAMTPYIANTLIHGWAGVGNVTKAKAIYDSLGNEKREPSTYEAMTRAFLSISDHANANAVAQEMLRKGYPAAVADKILVLVGGTTA